MKTTIRLIISLLIGYLFTCNVYGQTIQPAPTKTHIFPWVVSGLQVDKTSYQSLLWVQSNGATLTKCSVTGPFENAAFTIGTLPSFALNRTNNPGPLITTGATLTCDQPVTATLTYQYMVGSVVTGMTTVFSALPVYSTTTAVVRSAGHIGIALYNPTGLELGVYLIWEGTDGKKVQAAYLLPGTMGKFIDEYLNLTGMTDAGTITIVAINGVRPFYETNVIYSGLTFTTLVPAVTPVSN